MKSLLSCLRQISGRRYRLGTMLCSPEVLGIDSLTFVELVALIESEWGTAVPDNLLVPLYKMKLIRWRRAIFRAKKQNL